jgi:hypothetical protein
VLGIALTPLEVRTENFESAFQDATGLVDDYAARCAHRADGGAYFTDHPGRGELFVINVTRHVDRYLDAGIDEEANVVVIGLRNPSARAARILRRRYGPAVRMDPHPENTRPAGARE